MTLESVCEDSDLGRCVGVLLVFIKYLTSSSFISVILIIITLHGIIGLWSYIIIIIIIMKAKIIVTLYIKNVTGALYTVNYNENTTANHYYSYNIAQTRS